MIPDPQMFPLHIALGKRHFRHPVADVVQHAQNETNSLDVEIHIVGWSNDVEHRGVQDAPLGVSPRTLDGSRLKALDCNAPQVVGVTGTREHMQRNDQRRS